MKFRSILLSLVCWLATATIAQPPKAARGGGLVDTGPRAPIQAAPADQSAATDDIKATAIAPIVHYDQKSEVGADHKVVHTLHWEVDGLGQRIQVPGHAL